MNLDAKRAELARCKAEIARLEALIAANPGYQSAKWMLQAELAHAGRVRSFLALCGAEPVPETT